MTTDVKPCPSCGCPDPAEVLDPDGGGWLLCENCGLRGPWGPSAAVRVARWDALPRWPDWRPASSPPEMPEGKSRVKILVAYRAGHLGAINWNRGMAALPKRVTHWTHLPPGPGPGETTP